MFKRTSDSSCDLDDTNHENVTQGRFIGYVSTFPPQTIPRVSQIYPLDQTAGQEKSCPSPDKALAERRAMQLRTAAMISHDWNNVLMSVAYNIDHLSLLLPHNEIYDQALSSLRRSMEQLKAMNLHLAGICRDDRPCAMSWVDPPTAIRHAAERCRSHQDVEPRFSLGSTWPIRIDALDFARIIQNLVVNAYQAMSQGGDLSIRSENVMDGSDSHCVEITVSDEGTGINPQDLDSIFDPDFTTKDDGHGLGLAFVKAAVARCGGKIRVSSVVGSGTVFTLRFPAKAPKP